MRDANQWAEQIEKIEQAVADDNARITEVDYWAADREQDYRLANCNHEDSGYENVSSPFNPNAPESLVCYSCGRVGSAKEAE